MEPAKSNLCMRKKVFIQRDYSKGTEIKFETQIPNELKPYIRQGEFDHLVQTLNKMYQEAEQLSAKVCMESCLACLTAYITYLCFDTYFDKCMKKISAFIQEQNELVFNPRRIHIVDPIERGLRVIEIVLDNPQPLDPADRDAALQTEQPSKSAAAVATRPSTTASAR